MAPHNLISQKKCAVTIYYKTTTTKPTNRIIAKGDQINYCADVRTANLSSIDDKLACSMHAIDVRHQ